MKDEKGGHIIDEFAGLRAKMYSVRMALGLELHNPSRGRTTAPKEVEMFVGGEQLRAARDDSRARCRPSVFLDHC